jgi:hypothetical protein
MRMRWRSSVGLHSGPGRQRRREGEEEGEEEEVWVSLSKRVRTFCFKD